MSGIIGTQVDTTDEFDDWLGALQNQIAKAAITERIERLRKGLVGDAHPVTGMSGLYERRIDVGQGYRVYFIKVGKQIILLLIGGDKSTQKADIPAAKNMGREIVKKATEAKTKREEEERQAEKATEKSHRSTKLKRK
ncbi:type II toxin-antitoxin system RelE/ParE family toxin [Duganella sp. BuS-21]|uniref:type II toxin-antitoxin system RelE/ParE family toxin n=1 Tax=Duganella sp. BuS-21 TaxID=2943848 RepID=UPI0035A70CA2